MFPVAVLTKVTYWRLIFCSAWLCQQSLWNRNLSVVRPSSVRVAIISEPNARISFKFWLWFPLGHMLGLFFYFWFFFLFLTSIFRFRQNGTPWEWEFQKRYSSYKSQPNVLKLGLTFPPSGPHITTFVIFEILSFQFLMIFFFFENFNSPF